MRKRNTKVTAIELDREDVNIAYDALRLLMIGQSFNQTATTLDESPGFVASCLDLVATVIKNELKRCDPQSPVGEA